MTAVAKVPHLLSCIRRGMSFWQDVTLCFYYTTRRGRLFDWYFAFHLNQSSTCLCVTTPFSACSGDSCCTLLKAPRNLKAPLQHQESDATSSECSVLSCSQHVGNQLLVHGDLASRSAAAAVLPLLDRSDPSAHHTIPHPFWKISHLNFSLWPAKRSRVVEVSTCSKNMRCSPAG